MLNIQVPTQAEQTRISRADTSESGFGDTDHLVRLRTLAYSIKCKFFAISPACFPYNPLPPPPPSSDSSSPDSLLWDALPTKMPLISSTAPHKPPTAAQALPAPHILRGLLCIHTLFQAHLYHCTGHRDIISVSVSATL